MPRKPVQRSRTDFYHVTARSNNRDYFYLPVDIVWDIMTRKLAKLQNEQGIFISAFVVMNNHFHLLMLTPKADIDRVMYFFMKEVTLEIQRTTGRINKIFGGRYKASLVKNGDYLLNVYKYIYRNPVVVGLVERAENYPYSTLLQHHKDSASSPIKLEPIIALHAYDELRWINQSFSKDESLSISHGLKKTLFAFRKNNSTGKEIVPSVRHQTMLPEFCRAV